MPFTSNNGRREHEISEHPDEERELYGKRGDVLRFDSTQERDVRKYEIIAEISKKKLAKRDMLSDNANERISEVVDEVKMHPEDFLGLEPPVLSEPEPEIEPEPEPEPIVESEPEIEVPAFVVQPEIKPQPEPQPIPDPVSSVVVQSNEPEPPKPKKSGFMDIVRSIENNLQEDFK